jgi:hydrogenase-4 membrane subunit HyfE
VNADRDRNAVLWGALLVLVGVVFLLQNLGLLRGVNWNLVFAVVLILLGLFLIVRRR